MENASARTLTADPTDHWLATAGTILARAWSALRAFGRALRKEPVRSRAGRRRGRADRAAPSWMERGELPESYGRTRVVAMVVSPYLVHVYWDLAPDQRVQKSAASLRFHDVTAGGSFDVPVDLGTKNWYVHLWSPEKRYYVELGLQRGGGFTPLARSNTVETPRAWPVAEVRQVSDVAAPVSPEKSLPPPPYAAPAASPQAPAEVHTAPAPPLGQTPSRPSVLAESRPPTPAVTAIVAAADQREPAPAPAAPKRAADVLRKKLAELYANRWWSPRLAGGPAVFIPPVPLPVPLQDSARNVEADVTGRIETRFTPGISSVSLGNKPTG